MKRKQKIDIYVFGVLMIALFLRFIVYFQYFYYDFRADDFGPLTYPAYLAGYDWSTYLAGKMNYYGYGYYWIFAPLFRLVNSPKLLLALIIGINGLLVCLTSVLVYHLLVRYALFPRSAATMFFAVVPTMFQGDCNPNGGFWLRTDNEIPMFFGCWLLVWLLLKAQKLSLCQDASFRKRAGMAAGVSAVLCWMLTVHERALALMLSVIGAVLLIRLLKRRWLLQPAAFFISLAGFFILQRLLRSAVVNAVWAGVWPTTNTSAFSMVSLWFLESFTAVKSLLIMFFGNLHSFTIKAFGLPAFAAAITLAWIAKSLAERVRGGSHEKKTAGSQANAGAEEAWLDPFVLVMLVFGICVCVIIAGHAVRWGSMLYPGLISGELVYGYKGITYARYYYVFSGPIVFALFAYCFQHRYIKHSVLELSWGLWAAIELIFYAFVYPYCIRGSAKEGADYLRRSYGTFIIGNISNEKKHLITMSLMLITMLLVTAACAREKKSCVSDSRGEEKKKLPGALLHPCFQGIRALALAAVFLTGVFALDRAAEFEPGTKPSMSFMMPDSIPEAVDRLKEENALPENVYLQRNKWTYMFRYIHREDDFLWGAIPRSKLEEENMIIQKPDSRTRRYNKAKYQIFYIDGYQFITNCEKTAEALEAMADTD